APMEALSLPGLTLEPLNLARSTTQSDLSLSVSRDGAELRVEAEYSADLFDVSTVRRLLGHFRVLVESAIRESGRPLSDLPLLTDAERGELRAWSTGPASPVRPARCLHELIEERAARSPEALAVLTREGEALTYAQLDRLAGRLAGRLRRLGVGPDVPVAVHLHRSPELVVALLGVLKAGGAYLPLDPGYPEERLAYILEDSGAPVAVTVSRLAGHLGTARVLLLDETDEEAPFEPVTVDSENLAYIIYTSGSTGRPKGTGIAHGPAVEHMEVAAELFGLGPGERMLQFVSPGFDASMEEMLPALLSGATLVPTGPDVWPPDRFLERLAELGITVFDIPTAYWHQWVREHEDLGSLPAGLRLRVAALGGEAMQAEVARLWFRTPLANIQLLNTYGPTEAVVTATTLRVEADAEGPIPLGRSLAGRTSWVLDLFGNPAPTGVTGELCLGGPMLARGYQGRPDLTAERFVPDPFSETPGARLYRTGDLARWTPAGHLEFAGRADHQVKIRGFRIELGEIEAALSRLPGVREAVVLASDGRLTGYVVSTLSPTELRTALARELPDYMVPSAWVVLDAMPLTPNGKTDRRALARMEAETQAAEMAAPRTPVEDLVAGIWADLLGLDRVGIHDNFFELGGHSLLAMRVLSRLREAFGADLPLRRLFEAPTVATLAREIEAARSLGVQAPPLRRQPHGTHAPASFGQERLWFLDQLDPGSPAYNMPGAVRLTGRLDVPALAASLDEIVRRHESLRTTFAAGSDGVMQEIAPALSMALPVIDLRALPETLRMEETFRVAEERARRPFDLAHGPLLRAFLMRTADNDHVFGMTVHHIVSDGWSIGVLVTELAALYAAFSQGRPSLLPEPPVQYADFALWQRDWLSGEVLEGELGWWKNQLAGAPGFLPLPADRPRPAIQRFHGRSQRQVLSARREREVQVLSRREGGTPFMVLLAALDALLSRYTGQSDLTVGTPVAGREQPETEGLIGLFLNTLALRVDLSGNPSFRELLARVRETTLDSYTHHHLPFEKLVEELAPERDLSHAPLFQVLLVLQNAPSEPLELPEVTLAPVEVDTATSKFDLVLNATETGEGLSLLWMYNSDLFDDSRIARLRGHFARLLETAVADPGRPISELPLLSESERQQLLDWNATNRSWPLEQGFVALFHAQVARTPEAPAVSCMGETWTYRELADRTRSLAAALAAHGVRPERPVAVLAGRGLDLLTAFLALLECGGVYVPLDPDHPPTRHAQVLRESRARFVLAAKGIDEALALLPDDRPETLSFAGLDAPFEPWPYEPQRLAYVIYTSGSTGVPKGAMVEHQGMLNHLFVKIEDLGLTSADVVAQTASQCFDISIWQMLAALLVGGRTEIVLDEIAHDPGRLMEETARAGVTVLETVPSLMRVMTEEAALRGTPVGLRWMIPTGEALPPDLSRRWLELFPQIPLVNAYGPTECSDDVTHHVIRTRPSEDLVNVPIGKPVGNMRMIVADRMLHPLPVGVPGELLVAGIGVGRGYLHDPVKTASAFIPGDGGERLYRTGDLVRWLADGTLEFLGRIDHQVKVRGFRIELGEIEAALAAHPGVREAVVLAREHGGDRRLVAYLVPNEGPLETAALREHLGARLPEYMVPAAFVQLDAMPLTSNGKIDRKALPEPEAGPAEERELVEPRTPLERYLAGLWRDALKIDRISIHDSFFEMGGSSITGAVLINRLQRELGEIVHVVVLFDAPTVAKMADYLIRENREAVIRLWGEESLGDRTGEAGEREVRIDAAAESEIRAAIPALAPIHLELQNPPAVFVLSPPRSGSTLLRVMLGGHPELFSPPELELLSYNTMGERNAAFPGRDSFWLEGVIRAVMEALGCGPEEAKALVEIAEREDWTTQRFYGWLQEMIGGVSGRKLVDKTPSYALDPATLRRAEEAFDRPFYIHLIRHPQAAIRSFEEVKLDQLFFRHPHRFGRRELAELIWLLSHRNISDFLSGVPAERQHWVRFEDLVRDPERELRALCAAMGIEYHPDMADPYKEKRARMTDGIYAEGRMLGDVKFLQHGKVDASAAERWRDERDRLGGITWDMAEFLGYQRPGRSLVPIERRPIEPGEPLPLSFAQERLWFLDQLEPGSPLYNIPAAFRLDGPLDVPRLEAALSEIVRRHASLRTTFRNVSGEPRQVVAPASAISLAVIDTTEAEALRLAREEALRPFDLERGPLVRAALLRLDEEAWVVLVNQHHIVSDGWSLGVFVRELAALYADHGLPELPVQYVDFALWQREQLGDLEEQLAWWKQAVAGAPPLLELPWDHPRPPVQSYRGASLPVRLSSDLSRALEGLARRTGTTPFLVLLAGFQLLLHRLSGQDDLVVGSPVAGRNRAEIENLIGFFVNTLALRSQRIPSESFRERLAAVRSFALGAFAHQDLPFERLVDELQIERSLSRHPLFQVLFVLQNAGGDAVDLQGLTLSPLDPGTTTAKFDMTLSLGQAGEEIAGSVEYATDLFDEDTVQRWMGYLETLLAAAVAQPERRMSDLPLLSEAERLQIAAWNETFTEYPDVCLHELIEAQVERTPDAVAVVFEGETLTYRELDERASALAAELPATLIGISVERSWEMMVGLVAILKAGGVYVPIDPGYPADRVAYMIEDSGVSRVLTREDIAVLGRRGRDESRPYAHASGVGARFIAPYSGATAY
ncbi:MAG TPA: amino acid adenylation domain-containing protein, partial [Thermoanaerobaculia bacterium]|nr:amino acid adenylation domain-containing protein [Thermoanaerobaculia bacterium]